MKFKSNYFLIIPQLIWILFCVIFVVCHPEVVINKENIIISMLVLLGGCLSLYIISFPFFLDDVNRDDNLNNK